MTGRLRSIVRLGATLAFLLLLAPSGSPAAADKPEKSLPADVRVSIIQRAQIWTATTVSEMDLRRGPQGKGAFEPNEAVTCDYVPQKFDGASPKFDCRLADGTVVKVKFGTRGEVQGEVLATRLLWALGFGADRMYPAVVTCRGCAGDPWANRKRVSETHTFDPAVIERKAPGRELETKKMKGWAWPELELVNAEVGGAPIEQRDALKLLAVFIQHSDSKPEQQRLTCLDSHKDIPAEGSVFECAKPFMLINDLGQTFGRANLMNSDDVSAANFEGWSKSRVWDDDKTCVGHLSMSSTGTLDHPKISEKGRAFLAGLLGQLSDRQLHDLFDVARVELRSRRPGSLDRPATIDEWVEVFKRKRDEIANRRCAA